MYGYIYLTTNLINDKKYIGKHKYDKPEIDESYLGSGSILTKAFKKYGKSNFKSEIICCCETLKELNEKEQYYINLYNCVNNPEYYNITFGGAGGSAKGIYKHTEEAKKQISEKQKGKINHIQTEAEKVKRSESLKQAYAEGRHAVIKKGYPKGKKRSDEDIEKNRIRNQNKVWIKKDGIGTTILKQDIQKYLDDGWELGRPVYNSTAWNKGLSKITDTRVAQISETRKKLFKERGVIGCYGLKGQANKNSKINRFKKD